MKLNHSENKRLLIVAPFPPPIGGMSIQSERLVANLELDSIRFSVCNVTADLPKFYKFIAKIPLVRTIFRIVFILIDLSKKLPKTEIVYFISAFKNFFLWVTLPTLLFIKPYRKRVIISARGGAAEDFFRRWKLLGKLLLKLVDEITVPSEFLQEGLFRVLKYKPRLVPNIANIEQFQFRNRKIFQPNLIVTRHLIKLYNIECIILAFQKIQKRFPDARLAIVGGGPEEENLKLLNKKLGLKNVVFYGYVKHSQLPQLYDENDIFVNASNVDNFPGAILEAFASGLPVVTTRAGGIPYILKDSETGLLVDLNNHEQLAEKVIKLLVNQSLARQISQNARKESEKYSWKQVKNKFYEVCFS